MLIKNIILILSIMASVANAKDYWAAIFVDESSGIAGTSYDFGSEKEAIKNALMTCKNKSRKKICEGILSWRNSCGAAAWSPLNKSARSGKSDSSLKVAENNALQRCRKLEKDPNCKLVASVCTSWDTYQWWYSP